DSARVATFRTGSRRTVSITIIYLAPNYGGLGRLDRGFTTEAQRTLRRVFFPGRETTAREKSLRLRRKLFSLSSTVDMKSPGC
ncbi:MAG: hypothetical protein PVH15_07945, partial [Syntrophobacterales bacterium]